jgi:hypothetical protein
VNSREKSCLLNRKLGDGLSWETVRHFKCGLSKILGAAEEWGCIAENAAQKTKLPRRHHVTERVAVTPVQERDIAAVLNEPARSVTLLLVLTGLRVGELFALRWGSIDLKSRLLRIVETVYDGHFDQPKTKRSARTIPIGTERAEIFAAIRPAVVDLRPRQLQKIYLVGSSSFVLRHGTWFWTQFVSIWTQMDPSFLATRQTQGRRDSMGSAMTSSGKEQRFFFTLEICQSSRNTGQDCSNLASTHAFKRCAQGEFLSVYRGVLRYDPARLASTSCLQQTLDVFDSLNVPFPEFEFGVYLPRYRSRKSSIEPTKMCKQLNKFLPILRFR